MAAYRIWSTFFEQIGKRGNIKKKWTLYALTTVHFMVGVGAVIEYFLVRREINYIVTGIGFCMYVVAVIGRNWAIRTLGKYHSPQIEIRQDHKLIKNGPYAFLRHPYYVSVILEILGVPLIPNAYYAFCLALFVYVPLLFIRVWLEEKVMTETFGEEYSQYTREVFGLLPIRKK
jgi:isoprenylcysteine carboxyl methyltransferase (ICMT) family protein YpbQ